MAGASGGCPEHIHTAPPGKNAHFQWAFVVQPFLSVFYKVKGGRLWQAGGLQPRGAALLLWGEDRRGALMSRSSQKKVVAGVGVSGRGVRELERGKICKAGRGIKS